MRNIGHFRKFSGILTRSNEWETLKKKGDHKFDLSTPFLKILNISYPLGHEGRTRGH